MVDLATLALVVDSRQVSQAERGLDGLVRSGARAEAQVGRLTAAQRRLEAATRSTDNATGMLSRSFLGLGLGVALTAVSRLADAYTRYTNQLKIAGLEGAELSRVQQTLYETANRYGVELEGLGTLYARVAPAARELGASQGQLVQFTNAVAAAIKVQGGDANTTRGALLQLSQAMGSTIIRAEEFNAVLEGARPMVQAVANNIDRFGGSVTALRNEIIKGKVTSREFFHALLAGSAELEEKAGKAQLTIANSFQALTNSLTKYIGEFDAANGVTAKISASILLLANNLDKLFQVIGVVAVGFAIKWAAAGVSFVATEVGKAVALARTALAAEAQAAALAQLAAANAIARTTGGAMIAVENAKAAAITRGAIAARVATGAIATMTGAVRALIASVGGPFVIAFLAALGAVWAVVKSIDGANTASAGLTIRLEGTKKATDAYAAAVDTATGLTGQARVAADELAASTRNQAIAARDAAAAEMQLAFALVARLRAQQASDNAAAARQDPSKGGMEMNAGRNFNQGQGISRAAADAAAALEAVNQANIAIITADAQMQSVSVPTGTPAASTGGKGKGSNAASELERLIEAAKEYIKQLDQEAAAIGKTEIETIRLENANKLLEYATTGLTDEIKAAQDAFVQSYLQQQTMAADKEMANSILEIKDALRDETELLGLERKALIISQVARELANSGIKAGTQAYKDLFDAMVQAREEQRLESEYSTVRNANRDEGRGDAVSAVGEVSNTEQDRVERERAAYAEIEAMRQANVISEGEAQRAMAELQIQYNEQRLASTASFFDALSGLTEFKNKKLQAIGRAAALATATIDGVIAIQKAWSALPFPANLPGVATTTLQTGINIAKIAGLAGGGWVTGKGGPTEDKVLRRLSPGEYVVNAAAAAQNRNLLESINSGRMAQNDNRGRAIPVRSSGGIGGNVKVVIQNFGSNKSFDVQQISADEVRVIARDIADKQIARSVPGMMGQEIAKPNSPASRSLNAHTNTSRKRA